MSRKNRNNAGQNAGGYNVSFGGPDSQGQYGQQGYSVDYGSGYQGQYVQQGYSVDYGSGQNGYYNVSPGADPYAQQMIQAAPQQEMSGGRKALTFLGRSITITLKYFAAKLLISIIMGAAAWLIFMILGIPHPGFKGIILCIGNCIPIIGEWAAAAIIILPQLIPALGESGSFMPIIYTAIVLVVLEGLDDFVLTPIIVGKSLSFKPIIVLLVTIAISLVGGPFLGVLFAIPLIAIAKLFLDIFWFKKNLDN